MSYKENFRKIYADFELSEYDVNSEIDFVIELFTGLKIKDFLLGKTLNENQYKKIYSVLLKRVETGMPIQYVTNTAFFAGDKFFVNEHTLIPRPETEFLINVCCQKFPKNSKLKILDIGTGSGCISIELAKNYSYACIDAIDVCQDTLDAACININNYGFSNRICIYKSDLYECVKGKFDMIVSNPPYIPYYDKCKVQSDVLTFEPHRALFAKEDGLFFYRKIIESSKYFLNDNGFIAFELGINQSDKVTEILKNNGFINICLNKDCDNVNRVISADYSINKK